MKFNTDRELFEYLETHTYADAFSDIMDEMGIKGQVISPKAGIRPMRDDYVLMGRASTLLNDYDVNTVDPYKLAIECVDSLQPDSVVVSCGTSVLEEGIMGELTATAMRQKGGRGAYINGYSRDVRKLNAMNFPTFAIGSSPLDTTGRVRVVDYNIPVTIGGVTIQPGEIIFADLDGTVVLPKIHEDEIINLVLERIQAENVVREELESGAPMREVYDKYQIL
jgi:4-hydroxy-4-methyl-2-oxoglutarate aldolase